MAKEANLSFEESVAKLEEIVAAIESGQIGLEESLAKYEQGMALVKRCRGILDSAEKRIEQLSETKEGVKSEGMDAKEVLGDGGGNG
jgi:exodeoxyribonuclease VII small subunit